MASVVLKNISKLYQGGVEAVKGIDLEIRDKEFVVLVGPSGCGKSTTLRMIAGLETITSGELYIGSQLVNNTAPKDRDIAMVFQNYALYPHMNVYKNMAFGLRLRGMRKEEIKFRVEEAAKILNITELLERRPKELSGGQRQRVALGRAIVREPAVFLLDEPLSNLDAKLRNAMRGEICKLHKRLETTFVYVTHDQTEAMTMGDRIVVMKDGVIQQADTPYNVYCHPSNVFVASFIGSPQINLVRGKITEHSGEYELHMNHGKFELPATFFHEYSLDNYIEKELILGIRPEDITLHAERRNSGLVFTARVESVELMGADVYLYTRVNNSKFTVKANINTPIKVGEEVALQINYNKIQYFDRDTQNRIGV